MARKVKDTPVLTGKDAILFEKTMRENEKRTITPEEHQRILNALKTFKVVNRNVK